MKAPRHRQRQFRCRLETLVGHLLGPNLPDPAFNIRGPWTAGRGVTVNLAD